MSLDKPPVTSPTWSSATKTIIGLTMIAIVAALLITFRNIVGPLLLAFVLAYLLHPLASRLSNATRITWRASWQIGPMSSPFGQTSPQRAQRLHELMNWLAWRAPWTMERLL